MNKKILPMTGILLLAILLVTLSPGVKAQAPGDDRDPVYSGKCIDAGTVTSIDTDNKLLLVNSLDYGVVALKVSDSTEIKIGDNYLNFDDIRLGDNIGFQGYWSGNLLSANNIMVLQGEPSTYFVIINQYPVDGGNYQTTVSDQNVQTGYTAYSSLANLQIEKIVIRKGPSKINIRVRCYNNSPNRVNDYFAIRLYIRQSSTSSYELLKVWDEDSGLKAYNYLSRDYFLEAPSPYLLMGAFQVRAELVDAGGNIFYTFEQLYAGQDII